MLQVSHKTLEEIPEEFRALYTEQDDQFMLTGVQGVKTQGDIDRLTTALTKERGDHKETKGKLQEWGDLKHGEVTTQLDRIAELEVAAKADKGDIDAKLEELTEARVRSRLSPVERENKTLKDKFALLETEFNKLSVEKIQRSVHDEVRAAAAKLKVISEAVPDVLLLANAVFEVTEEGAVLTRENRYGITPGLAADVWLGEMQEKRPHWWPANVGAGAPGSGPKGGFANNPWAHDHWNITNQGKVYKEQGKERAEQMAKVAGTTVGGQQPKAPAPK